MGLDQYLLAQRYVSKRDEENEKIRALYPEMYKTHNLDNIHVDFEIGYWRKANQIHAWFVKQCQDGNDDCGTYRVSREELEELKKICEAIITGSQLENGIIQNGSIANKETNFEMVPNLEQGKVIADKTLAESLLPSAEGFFFGNTDYNEWYMDDVKLTISIITKALKLSTKWEFYYHSSW